MSDEPKNKDLSRLPPLDLGRQAPLDLDALGANVQDGEILEPAKNLRASESEQKLMEQMERAIYKGLYPLIEEPESNVHDAIVTNVGTDVTCVVIIQENTEERSSKFSNFYIGINEDKGNISASLEQYQSEKTEKAQRSNILTHDLDINGDVSEATVKEILVNVAEKAGVNASVLIHAALDGETIDATAAPVPQVLGAPAAEIMHPEEHAGGLSHAEDDLYDKMGNIANGIMFAALTARIPMHMAPVFTYGQRDGQNIGGFAVQVPKQGHDTNLITYTTNIDEHGKTITITPKEQSQFTMVNDQNETAEVIEDHSDNQIVAALGADGLVTDETLELFIEDVAEKMGISADIVWKKMMEAREMDGEIIGFDPDSKDDGLTF